MRRSLGELEQLLLLALLRLEGKPAYGVPIRREIELRAGRKLSAGAVYTAFERLEKRGLVSSRLGEPTASRGGKRKRLYRLEPAGRTALARSYRAIQEMAQVVAQELEIG